MSSQTIQPGQEITVSFNLTNTGDVTGTEITQVYVSGEGFEIDTQKYTRFTKDLANGEQIAVVNVNGMVCDFCARGIEKTFMKNANVKKVDVDLEVGKVLIAYSNGTEISFEDIKEKITSNGQTAVDMKVLKL